MISNYDLRTNAMLILVILIFALTVYSKLGSAIQDRFNEVFQVDVNQVKGRWRWAN